MLRLSRIFQNCAIFKKFYAFQDLFINFSEIFRFSRNVQKCSDFQEILESSGNVKNFAIFKNFSYIFRFSSKFHKFFYSQEIFVNAIFKILNFFAILKQFSNTLSKSFAIPYFCSSF